MVVFQSMYKDPARKRDEVKTINCENVVNLLSKMRFYKTFWENRQVLQTLSKKLLPLSLTIPCFEAQCGLKRTICLFHSFPVCSCILYRLLLLHICLRSKNTKFTAPYLYTFYACHFHYRVYIPPYTYVYGARLWACLHLFSTKYRLAFHKKTRPKYK